MALTEAQKKAKRNYESKAYRNFRIRVNQILEPELLEHLEKQKSIQGYILNLIREDMNK